MLLRIAHKLSLISIGYLLPTFIALADSPVIPYNQAPREIQEAISLRILEVENRLETFWHPERTKGFVRAHVEIQTKNRFHLYQDKTSFSTPADDLIGGHPWILKVTSAPVAKPFFDIVTKTLKPSYSGTQVFVLDLELPEDYPGRISTTHQLNLDVHFQACSDSKCLLPSILRLPLPVYMGPQPETKLSWQESIQRLVETQIGSQSYLLLALLFLAGLITALPLVFTRFIQSHWGFFHAGKKNVVCFHFL